MPTRDIYGSKWPERGRNLADGLNSIRPLNLMDKLKCASKATRVDEELARSIIDDPDWKGKGTIQDGIFEELMKEEAPPTMPEEEEEPSYDSMKMQISLPSQMLPYRSKTYKN